ncbi:TorF family putative porin [Rubellicoccus peritrichatus]|uniref:TorF family putative porin n=1 Tax=Rubellicoccus peritrichatus TaxID=3080537 RepID=A0AAQ3QVR3_9BACT|nr:TorF family putative porin [Puniceicoccus sp. CR14]WOO41898.1 TorF family putative porin [Puniceicoccus sp. CR14]
MKKFIASLAIATAAAGLSAQETGSSISDLSITGTFDFETQYVFRGVALAQQSFQPSVEFGFPVLGGDLYTGVWTNQPITNGTANEIDFYGGFAYPVTDMFTVDVGFTYYWYPEGVGATPGISQTREIYVGVSADVILSPALYFYYDFDLEQTVLEGSIGYSFDLGEYIGTEGVSFDLGGYLGWLNADAANGSQRGGVAKAGNGYTYLGVTADLVYAFSENVSSSLGVRYSYNNDGTLAQGAITTGKENNLWFGATLGFAY